MSEPRCELCFARVNPTDSAFFSSNGAWWCSDLIECKFRARRRLGMPVHVCIAFKSRELRDKSEKEGVRAERIKALPPPSRNADYAEVIASPRWREFSEEQKLLARHRCEGMGCGIVTNELDTHHLHYKTMGAERPQDVLVLCRQCHLEHDEMRGKKSPIHPRIRIEGTARLVEWVA